MTKTRKPSIILFKFYYLIFYKNKINDKIHLEPLNQLLKNFKITQSFNYLTNVFTQLIFPSIIQSSNRAFNHSMTHSSLNHATLLHHSIMRHSFTQPIFPSIIQSYSRSFNYSTTNLSLNHMIRLLYHSITRHSFIIQSCDIHSLNQSFILLKL